MIFRIFSKFNASLQLKLELLAAFIYINDFASVHAFIVSYLSHKILTNNRGKIRLSKSKLGGNVIDSNPVSGATIV